MPKITAILHTHNDELRISRAIESLRPCDEVLVVDRSSTDTTRLVAGKFGARVVPNEGATSQTKDFLGQARYDWIFCMYPAEALLESLEAELLEWKLSEHSTQICFAPTVVEEEADGWGQARVETRLVHRQNSEWWQWQRGKCAAVNLEGTIVRMKLP